MPTAINSLKDDIGQAWRAFRAALLSREGLVIILCTLLIVTRSMVRSSDALVDIMRWLYAQTDINVLEFGHWKAVRIRVTAIVFFGLAPLLAIRFMHREALTSFGLGRPKKGWIQLTLFIFALQLLFIPLAAGIPSIADYYPMLKAADKPGLTFWQWEVIMLGAMISWELLIRGYLMFGLEKRFGIYAVLVQTMPFVLLHMSKPTPEIFFSLLDGLALGLIAYAARSIWPAVFLHAAGAFALDFYLVHLA